MKGQSRSRGHANIVRSDGCQHNRAGGGAKPVNDDRLTRSTHFFVHFHVVGDRSAAITRNAYRGMARTCASQQKHSCEETCCRNSHVARSMMRDADGWCVVPSLREKKSLGRLARDKFQTGRSPRTSVQSGSACSAKGRSEDDSRNEISRRLLWSWPPSGSGTAAGLPSSPALVSIPIVRVLAGAHPIAVGVVRAIAVRAVGAIGPGCRGSYRRRA